MSFVSTANIALQQPRAFDEDQQHQCRRNFA